MSTIAESGCKAEPIVTNTIQNIIKLLLSICCPNTKQ